MKEMRRIRAGYHTLSWHKFVAILHEPVLSNLFCESKDKELKGMELEEKEVTAMTLSSLYLS